MPDNNKQFSGENSVLVVDDILKKLGCIEYNGSKDQHVSRVAALNSFPNDPETILWCSDKNFNLLEKLTSGTVICSPSVKNCTLSDSLNLIIVDDPRYYFAQLVSLFFNSRPIQSGISSTAVIHESVRIGTGVYIGNHVVIEENCIVGDGCSIGHNTVIRVGTIIGNNVQIGCNNTIGSMGFGYQKNKDGVFEQIPHIGNVEIHDQVEIGNNNCIDRAVLGSTLIERNVKIDNLVHIAHGVQIGENSLIIANAMIAGSVVIGKNSWIAPSASIMNQLQIGSDSVVGLGAVVVKSVNERSVVAGNPARELQKK